MDYLCECNNDRDRREALKKLPPDLPSSYERILERVNRSSKENQALVVKTLHWIVYADDACGRVFTTDMLLQALAIRDGDEFFDRNSMTTEKDILHWCSSLVRKNIWSESLEISHFTVKEFLQTIDPVQQPHLRQYCLSGDHTILAKACLKFIQCPQFAELPNLMPGCKRWTRKWSRPSRPSRRASRCSCSYEFISYACNNWSYHVHRSSWDIIQEDVDSILCTETALRCWTMHWLHYKQPEDYSIQISELFTHPQAPSPLHWAALFGFDKLCATYLQNGMDASQQSCLGTPLYCAMLSRSAMKSVDNLLKDEMGRGGLVQNSRSWQPQARQSVIRQLLEARLDVDERVDPQGQRRALSIALKLEFWRAYSHTFISSTLVTAGARFSTNDFSILRQYVKTTLEFYLFDGGSEHFDMCGLRVSLLMEAITRESWKALRLGAEFEFSSLALELVSCNWPLQSFQSFLHVRFKDLFPKSNGSELDKLLRDESEDWGSRLVHVLSKAIVNSAATPDRATSRLQRALFYASATSNASAVSLLLAFNPDLDASRRDMRSKDAYLHPTPQETLESAKDLELIESYGSHSKNVLLPDKSGISPIEYAAYDCPRHIFRLYWDFGGRSGTFGDQEEPLPNDLPWRIVTKVLVAGIESRNRPVMELVMEDWFGKSFRSKTGDKELLRFAVEQETSTLLKTLIDDEKDCYSSSERASDDENNDEENQSYSGDIDDRDGVFLAGGNKRQRRRKSNCDTANTSLELQAFHLAATSDGSVNNFTFLLERGLPTSHQDHDGNAVLHLLAAQNSEGSIPKLQALLKMSQPKLDILNKSSLTPLALATQIQNIQIMELLLDAGADPEITLVEDQTALRIACDLGNQRAVEVLLKHGCQTSPMNSQGQTPKDIALAKGHHEIATVIQNTIDSTIPSRETQPSSSSGKEYHTDTALSNCAQTENHGELPLRVVKADTIPNEALDDVLDAANPSTTIISDTMAAPSQPTAKPIPSGHPSP
jgi:ankyrin repeat protein